MRAVNMSEAGAHPSRLVEAAAGGEPFIIARAGKPMVKVVALDTPDARHRTGFLVGQISVPDDFDSMGSEGDPNQLFRAAGEAPAGHAPVACEIAALNRPRAIRILLTMAC